MGKVLIALFILLVFLFTGIGLLFTSMYQGKIYPHVSVGNRDVGGMLPIDVESYWLTKNTPFTHQDLVLQYDGNTATISAVDLGLGYDATLSATQAYLIGRSPKPLTNLYFILSQKSVNLAPYFRWNTAIVDSVLTDIASHVDIPATDALFQFNNGRVTNFRPSASGRQLNIQEANARITKALYTNTFSVQLPIETILPSITTDKVNTFGITQLIGTGYSEFAGSIPGRIHNVILAASRLNGVLIKPGETFSFNDTIGDISAATGYQSAYIIKDGHTILGDGGGVCQVSTTLFRAALNAGLPIIERHAHDYRVHYYEEGGFAPGLDATVYNPTDDLKFTNDTNTSILIQSITDANNLSLTFTLYGTNDGRKAQITNQQLWDVTSPPPDLYQEDPTLPRGTIRQVDFSAWGAKASFDYIVTKSNNTVTHATFLSNYQPWHYGHISFLRQAKSLGNYLIVALESDETVRRMKGESRPIHTQIQRKEMLESVSVVDEVIALPPMHGDRDYYEFVRTIKPTIIAITEGDTAKIKKSEQAADVGARLVEIPKIHTLSTSQLAKLLGLE